MYTKELLLMKITSSSEERIEDSTNGNLFPLVSVIYGAVFSYAMYIFSSMIISAYNEWVVSDLSSIYNSKSLKEIVLFLMFMIYMIEDVGSIMKLGNLYPFKRTSRYTFEILIALFYICTFSMLASGIYYCTIFFAVVIFLQAIWFNQFKEEYSDHESNIKTYSTIERDLHYIGAFLLIVQPAIFIILNHKTMEWLNILTFVMVLCLWMFIAAKWICLRTGDHVMKCRVMVFLPDYYVKKICSKHSTLTIN